VTTPSHPTESETTLASTAERGDPWTIANLLTIFRIALTLPFLYLVVRGRFDYALTVFFLASVTDVADGYVARRFNQNSRLGRMLDPAADKLLTTVGFVALAIPRSGLPSIPIWLAAGVVGRDLVIVLGSAIVYRITRFKEFKPTIFGKINTFVELGLITWFLASHTIGHLVAALPSLYFVVIASVAVSGTEYLIKGLAILNQNAKHQSSDSP
jgi:cardiolipin synthase (CMP-forming)